MAATNISPTRFYTEVLGARLASPPWCWGAHDPLRGQSTHLQLAGSGTRGVRRPLHCGRRA